MYEFNGNTDHVRRLAELKLQEDIARAARYRSRRTARRRRATTERALSLVWDAERAPQPTLADRLTAAVRRLAVVLTRG